MDNPDKDLYKYLLNENIIMRVEIGALKTMTTFALFSLNKLGVNLSNEHLESFWREALRKSEEDVLTNHPLFEEAWRSDIDKAIGDLGSLFVSWPDSKDPK